jgi:hypothetical protein
VLTSASLIQSPHFNTVTLTHTHEQSNTLQEFIAGSKATVAALVAEVGKAHARLAALDEFCYRLSSEDMQIAWRALDYPGLVERAAARTEEALELDKVSIATSV